VCLSVRVFLGYFVTDWETLWHKVSLCFRKCSKTIKFQKKLFFAELLPFFYISLRFLYKFEERLYPVTLLSPCFSISGPGCRYSFEVRRAKHAQGSVRGQLTSHRDVRTLPVFSWRYIQIKNKNVRTLTYQNTDCIFGISMVELVKISRADFQ